MLDIQFGVSQSGLKMVRLKTVVTYFFFLSFHVFLTISLLEILFNMTCKLLIFVREQNITNFLMSSFLRTITASNFNEDYLFWSFPLKLLCCSTIQLCSIVHRFNIVQVFFFILWTIIYIGCCLFRWLCQSLRALRSLGTEELATSGELSISVSLVGSSNCINFMQAGKFVLLSLNSASTLDELASKISTGHMPSWCFYSEKCTLLYWLVWFSNNY